MGKPLDKHTLDNWYSMGLTLPALIISTVFILIPIVDSVVKSFLQYGVKNIISGKPGVWNQFANYRALVQSNALPNAIRNTFFFVVFVILFQFVLGMSTCEFYEILKKQGVITVPGEYSFFGHPDQKEGKPYPHEHYDKCLRLNYSAPAEKVRTGLDIIAQNYRRYAK